VHRRVRAATSADRPFGLEYRIVRADGTAAWVLERGQQVVAADGTACLHGVIFDVTERRELKAQRARIIAAQDETRRQIGRDLHDGAQQRLVSVSLALRALRSRLPDHPRGGGRDGRRGEHGLPTAVPALAARATVPVDVTCTLAHRLRRPWRSPPTTSSRSRSRTWPGTPGRRAGAWSSHAPRTPSSSGSQTTASAGRIPVGSAHDSGG